MKIFVIARGFPSQKDPQWGNFETDQARALAALGHKVVLLSVDLRYAKTKNKLGITKIEEGGLVSYSLNPGPLVVLRSLFNTLYKKISSFLLLKLYTKVSKIEGKPDLIYSHYQDNIEHSLSIKKKYGIPIVGLEHWSALGYETPPQDAIDNGKRTYQEIDKLLVVSQALKKNIKQYCDVDSEVLNNIIGDEFCYKEHSNTDGIVHFVLTGNLKPVKCIDLAINAFTSVAQQNGNVCFTIVGDGVERDRLNQLVEKNKMTDKVQLVGRKDRGYLVHLLQESDVYVLSSSSETFGVAAGEALACGVPVIATDCGGPRDFMNDFNGMVVPVNDTHAMTEAMLYMTEHYKGFDRKRIAQDCHDRFSSEAIAKQLTAIFKQVVES